MRLQGLATFEPTAQDADLRRQTQALKRHADQHADSVGLPVEISKVLDSLERYVSSHQGSRRETGHIGLSIIRVCDSNGSVRL